MRRLDMGRLAVFNIVPGTYSIKGFIILVTPVGLQQPDETPVGKDTADAVFGAHVRFGDDEDLSHGAIAQYVFLEVSATGLPNRSITDAPRVTSAMTSSWILHLSRATIWLTETR